MNKEKFQQSLDNIHVPVEKLKVREKTAMLLAKRKQKSRKTTTRSLLVACGLCVSLLGSGFVSTNMANALSNIPIIGSFYKDFRDVASDKIEQEQLMTVINKQASKNGLTMTVKEAAYDGNRLSVSVVYTSETDFDTSGLGTFGKLLINGEQAQTVFVSQPQDDIDSKTIIEYYQMTLAHYDESSDEIDVTVHGAKLFGEESALEVSFPLKKLEGEITEFTPGVSATTNDEMYAITAEKVAFYPLGTRIDLYVDYPAEMEQSGDWPWFEYYALDDTGKIYEALDLREGVMPETSYHHIVLTLPPMDKIPATLTLIPQRINDVGRIEDMKELTLVLPLAGSK